MKAHRVLLLTFLSLAALPLVAQVNDTYVIPVAANAHGAAGSNWKTQISIFNPQLDRTLTITIAFVPTGGATGDRYTIDVPANSMAYSDNILADSQFAQASGSLLVYADTADNPGTTLLTRSFLVTSNTYNDLGNHGTYGQTIPGIWTGLQDFSDRVSAVAHGIQHNLAQGWRTNIGALNLGRCNVTLLVSVYDVDGRTLVKQAPFELPPLGHMQESLGNILPLLDRGSVEFMVDDPCRTNADNAAVVFPYTSTVDQLSGDPQYQSPTLLAPPGSIFSKAAAVAPAQIGKPIDNARAHAIRETMNFRGSGRLVRETSGWRITR
ncbi:MAG TPA: hypothetical protein VLU46_07680 [Thermoanaerobaculia bacterium]|nr:hypothetical protein [Thermoanaerobaculia bacterium]